MGQEKEPLSHLLAPFHFPLQGLLSYINLLWLQLIKYNIAAVYPEPFLADLFPGNKIRSSQNCPQSS